jgi:hypothetical protein
MSVFTDGFQSDDSFWYVLSACFLRYFVKKCIKFIKLSAKFFCFTNLRHLNMRRLTTGLHLEKFIVRRFHRCANIMECAYTNLEGSSKVYYTPSLQGVAYCSYATNLYNMLLY